METIGCILCGGTGNRVVIEENGYQGRRCDACGIIFVSPRPSLEDISAIYASDTAHVSSAYQVRPSVGGRLHARHTLRLLRRYRKSGRLVEIGAGGGHFVTEARSAGYEVSAVEANPVPRDHIRSLGIPCTDTLEAHCDIVYACDVLSHFYDPESEMRDIHAHLGKDGLLVLETGNGGDVLERYFSRFAKFQYPDHLFFFGELALRELLSRTGFRVVSVSRYNILPNLWVFRTKERIRRALGAKDRVGRAAAGAASPKAAPQRSAAGSWKRDALDIAVHFTRYGLGRILPKRGRPQTIIVVAETIE
jgi:SAM-dependent methyltransferase